jgi:hypothetical protein
VLYVGQSETPLSRLGAHSEIMEHAGIDSVYLLPCLQEHLNLLEGAFIRAWNPVLNRSRGPVSDPATLATLFPEMHAWLSQVEAVPLPEA